MELTTNENVKSPPGCIHDRDLLVQACKDGDAAAFEQMVTQYGVRLFSIARHITHRRKDAKKAFVKVFRTLRQFQKKSQFSAYPDYGQ